MYIPLTVILKEIKTDIKVGCEYGSSYRFIGSVPEFLKKMDTISKKFKVGFEPTPEKVEKFIPLRKRMVVNTFKADEAVDDTTVIIIEGNERGKMWFKGEKDGK